MGFLDNAGEEAERGPPVHVGRWVLRKLWEVAIHHLLPCFATVRSWQITASLSASVSLSAE